MAVAAVRKRDKRDDQNQKTVLERFSAVLDRLRQEAMRRDQRRRPVEQRWIDDLRQFHGQYPPDVMTAIRREEGSRVFVNITRAMTNRMAARLVDLLFPTDDSNWSIAPTPVPELTQGAEDAARQAQDATERARETGDPAAAAAADQAHAAAMAFDRMLDEARRRARAMQAEIEDVFAETRYEAACRDVIEDACRLGVGIMQGPVLGVRQSRKWTSVDGMQVLEIGPQPADRPSFVRIDPWSFFPDPDARTVGESEGVFIRHLMKARDLRKLAQMPGFSADAIRDALNSPDRDLTPQYLMDLRSISTEYANDLNSRPWHVWEYAGPLSSEDITALADALDDDGMRAEAAEADPLREINVVVWFCGNRILKFAAHPMDSGEPMFSVFTLERDDSSIFGAYGVPRMLADEQAIVNAAWRMMMDNSALGTAPQIVVSTDQVEPADGKWTLRQRKLWRRKAGADARAPAFETYDIPMHQGELANLIAMARQAMDDVTAMPQVAQGEPGTGVERTATGTALLMNSANVVFRRIVRNFDDDFSVPNVRRAYDWLMQFSPKEEIKGDMQVSARGSSVLLVREMQAQNLMVMALQFGADPEYGPAMKKLDVLREIFRAHMLPPGEYLLSEAEHKAELERRAAALAPPVPERAGPDPEMERAKLDIQQMEIEAKVQIANMDADARLRVAQMSYDATMADLAERMNLSIEQVRAKGEIEAQKLRSSERRMAVEVSAAQRTGKHAGGSI